MTDGNLRIYHAVTLCRTAKQGDFYRIRKSRRLRRLAFRSAVESFELNAAPLFFFHQLEACL